MKRALTLLLFLSLPLLTSAGERAEPMSDKDWAAFEAKCQTNPDCVRDLAQLKGSMDKHEAELKALCDKDAAACAQRMEQEATEQRQRFAVCDDPATCVATLNRDMDAREVTLEQSAWCSKRSTTCAKQKQVRAERQAKGLAWCDSYKAVCDRAVADAQHAAQERAQQEAQLRAARDEAQAKKTAAETKIILGNLDRWLEQQATCTGPDNAKCVSDINARLDESERNLEDAYCKESGPVCNGLKHRRAARIEAKKTWCEAHAERCNAAQQQAAQTHRALVDEAERVTKACAANSEQCEAARRSSYDALVSVVAKCDGAAATCRDEIESRIVARETDLDKGPWCDKHRQFCDREMSALGARMEKKDGWCANHEPICAVAERGAQQREQKQQQAERQEVAADWNKGLNDYAAAVASACPNGKVDACIARINSDVKKYIDKSQSRWCNGSPRRAQNCEVIRAAGAEYGEQFCQKAKVNCAELIAKNAQSARQ